MFSWPGDGMHVRGELHRRGGLTVRAVSKNRSPPRPFGSSLAPHHPSVHRPRRSSPSSRPAPGRVHHVRMIDVATTPSGLDGGRAVIQCDRRQNTTYRLRVHVNIVLLLLYNIIPRPSSPQPPPQRQPNYERTRFGSRHSLSLDRSVYPTYTRTHTHVRTCVPCPRSSTNRRNNNATYKMCVIYIFICIFVTYVTRGEFWKFLKFEQYFHFHLTTTRTNGILGKLRN